MTFGLVQYSSSTLTAGMSFHLIVNSLLTYSKPPHLPFQPSNMIGTLENDTLDNLTASTVAEMSFPFHYYLSFYLMLFHLVLSLLGTSVNLLALKNSLGSTLRQFARTGILALVMVMHVITDVATMNAASVVSITELKTERIATLPSIIVVNSKEQQQLERAAHKAQEAKVMGTCQLKHKAVDSISEIPCYKRGFVWNKSSTSEEAEKEYARQRELEKARSEKRKAVEIEESREETEKEPEGSNKKVSKTKLGFE
jgi:hypothetical protein